MDSSENGTHSNAEQNEQYLSMMYFTPKMCWERPQRRHIDGGYIIRSASGQKEHVIPGLADVKQDPALECKTKEALNERYRKLRNQYRNERRHYRGNPTNKSYLDDYF